MRSLLSSLLLVFLLASCCETTDEPLKSFRFKPGDMPKHKLHGQKVLVLDTIRVSSCNCEENGKLTYKVKGKDLNIHTISELELY